MAFHICIKHASESYSECIQTADKGTKKCAKYRDDGYSACSQYKDNGYSACASYQSRCCTWWPCSWLCDIVSWICNATVWITNIICVTTVWVSNIICVSWIWVSALVCLVWTTINVITCIAWSIIDVVLLIIAPLINLIFSIPVLGRIIKNLVNLGTDIGARVVSLPDSVLVKINVLILRTEEGMAVIQKKDFNNFFDEAKLILKREANINLYIDQIITVEKRCNKEVLDVSCDAAAIGEDLLLTGTGFEQLASENFGISAGGRITGLNPSIIVFIVRTIDNLATLGCSQFSNTDYITLNGSLINNNLSIPSTFCKETLAHEIGHKCGLIHSSNINNLMYGGKSCSTTSLLEQSEVLIMRRSKFVTS
jgi:hypothetical protein